MSRRESIARARSCCSLCQRKSSQREDCKRRRKRRRKAGVDSEESSPIYYSFARKSTSIKKEFSLLSYCLLNSMYSSFCILIDSTTRVLSLKVVHFVLSSCKFKFLTYHLRDNFLGVYRVFKTRSDRSVFSGYTFLRDRLFGSDYFGDVKSLSRVSWMCPCVIYNLCIHSPFLHPVASSWLTHM